MNYSFTRESQVRAAFWQGFPNRPKKLKSGDEIRKEHGYGFDAWEELIKLEAAMRLA